LRHGSHRPLPLRDRPRRVRPHPGLPRVRERDLRPRDPGDLWPAVDRRGGRLPRRARRRADHGGCRRAGPPRARLDRGGAAPGAARMTLLALLAIPLAGALLLAQSRGRLATAVHALHAGLPLAAAAAVAPAVPRVAL